MHELPAVGETVIVSGGTVTRKSELEFKARSERGRHYQSRTRTSNPATMFRSCENWLRAEIGLPKLPPLCIRCSASVLYWKDSYCSDKCRKHWHEAGQPRGEPAPLPPVEVILERLHVIAPDVPSERGRAQPDFGKGLSNEITDALGFRAALKRADDLIRAKGGEIPRGISQPEYEARQAVKAGFWKYFEQHRRRAAPPQEKVSA